MARCVPRRTRQMWVLFLLGVCLIGIYLTYTQLTESEKHLPSRPAEAYHLDNTDLGALLNKEKTLNLLKEKVIPQPLKDAHPDLVPVLRDLENDEDYVTEDEKLTRLKSIIIELSPVDWKAALDAGDMVLKVKCELSDLGYESEIGCDKVDKFKTGNSKYEQTFFGQKAIQRVIVDEMHHKMLIVKSIGNDQPLKVECMKQDYDAERCSLMGNYKLLKELVLMLVLDHPSIMKPKGFCLRGDSIDYRVQKKGTFLLTEPGTSLSVAALDGALWREKIMFSHQLVQMITYLEDSPLGSLGFDKLQINDFVMIEQAVPRAIKLVDFDDIHIGEMRCKKDKDCAIQEMSMKVIPCVDGRCQGRNSLNNLLWVYRSMLYPMLNNIPPQGSGGTDMRRFLSTIQDLKVTVKEVLDKLHELSSEKEKLSGSLHGQAGIQRRSEENLHVDANKFRSGKSANVAMDTKQSAEVLTPAPPKSRSNGRDLSNEDELLKNQMNNNRKTVDEMQVGGEYIRKNDANYPGMFDYTCHASRVSWGCVVSVHNLAEAKSMCDHDESCKSFVVFSTNPDLEALMTMVMKNAADAKPETNYGATLFLKKERKIESPSVSAAPGTPRSRGEDVRFITFCQKRVLNLTESARASRERRLMTHLGYKGMAEADWMYQTSTLKVQKSLGKSKLSPQTKGGRYSLVLTQNHRGIDKVDFLLEKGPLHTHIGYMLTYILDRELGLYSTPPAVVRTFSTEEVLEMRGGDDLFKELKDYKTDNDTFKGVMSMPIPHVMKTEKFSLPILSKIPDKVKAFSRMEKIQMEYLLLWSLVKMLQPQHGYLGYKGHLIHFEADLAFQNTRQSLTSYFYSCQFPTVAYKSLHCFRCGNTDKTNAHVCGFGQAIIHKMKEAGFKEQEMQIGNLNFLDLVKMINNSAESILTIVDKCIKQFTREKVLY